MKLTLSVTDNNKLEIDVPDSAAPSPKAENAAVPKKKSSRRTKGRRHYKVNEATALKLINSGMLRCLHGVHEVEDGRMYYFDKVDEVKAALNITQAGASAPEENRVDLVRVPICNPNDED